MLVLLTLLTLVVPPDDPAAVEVVPSASAPAPSGRAEVVATPAPAPGQTQQVGGVAVPTGPGDPTVYQDIAALTDCDELQQQSDTAANTYVREEFGSPLFEIQLSYMVFADERLQALSCY